MGNQNFIEINGKKYDAATGKIINSEIKESEPTAVIQPNKNVGVVDGFVKQNKPRPNIARTQAKHSAKAVQKSQTLMRSAVKKPSPVPKQKVTPNHLDLKKRLGSSSRRSQIAQEIKRSPSIRKFEHPLERSSVVKKHSEISVKPAPSHIEHNSASNNQGPIQHQTNQNAQSTAVQHSVSAKKIIESALNNAQSHTEPAHKSPKKRSKFAKKLGISARTASVSMAVLAGVLLGGFFAIQNVPNLAMKVAATRAGFDAEMPNYQPSGFSYKGPIKYSAGQVTVSFRSNTDSRSYDLTQKSSNWNSDALLSNYIVAENKQYQTYLDKGRTLYIYNGSNATWVDNGVWYQIEGDSDMTTDQLIRIASSI